LYLPFASSFFSFLTKKEKEKRKSMNGSSNQIVCLESCGELKGRVEEDGGLKSK
jgi:hypothetical protein